MSSRSLPAPPETLRQLALPLDQPSKPSPPPTTIAPIRPERILATLPPSVRQQIRQTWVRVFQEVVCDARGD